MSDESGSPGDVRPGTTGARGPGPPTEVDISPVTYFVVPSEIRRNLYEAAGLASPVKGVNGLWVLLPLIGSLIWFFKVQGALNEHRTSNAQ